MRLLKLGTVAWLVMCAGASAQTPNAQLMAPIQKFMDAFNKGDTAGAAATHLVDADLAIIDEVAPFFWRGAQALQSWAAALDGDAKKRVITDPAVTLSAPTRTEASGDQAYVVVPAVYSFKQKGVAMRETGQMTFALKKGASGWLIHGWTWSGRTPTAVAAK